MNSMVLTAVVGQEVFQKGLSKLQVFIPSSNAIPTGAKDSVPIGASRSLSGFGVSMIQNGARTLAIQGEPEEHCGAWSQKVVQLPNDAVVQVFGQRRARWNSLLSSASIYLRIRSGAAHQRIKLPTLQVAGASTRSEVFVEGRFDIITPETAEAFGVTTSKMYAPMFKTERVDHLFVIEEVSPESVAAAQAVTTQTLDHASGAMKNVSVTRIVPIIEL